ncbi:hypothetical protein KKI24_25530 [bacterium]|nr:hypothetical protein [bacterium]
MNKLSRLYLIIRKPLYFLIVVSSSVSCAIAPNQIDVVPNSILGNQEIIINEESGIATSIFCSELQKAKVYETLSCKSTQNNNDKDLTLKIETVVKNSSSDYWRNSRYSLYTLGTLLLVTTSADIEYHFMFVNQNKVLKSYRLSSRGRIGVWAIQPVLMGFIGLSLGTATNTDMLPESLHKECSSLNRSDPLLQNRKCQAYQRFIQDSMSFIWKDFLEIQSHYFKMARQGHFDITQQQSQKSDPVDINTLI